MTHAFTYPSLLTTLRYIFICCCSVVSCTCLPPHTPKMKFYSFGSLLTNQYTHCWAICPRTIHQTTTIPRQLYPPHISKHTWPRCTGFSLCYCCIINIFSHQLVTNKALLLHMSNLHLAPVSNIPPRARVMKLIKNMQPLTYQLLFVFPLLYSTH